MKSASGESLPAGAVNTSHHPYKMPPPIVTLLKYDDFPLRKTGTCNAFAATINRHNKNKFCVSSIFFLLVRIASEPNLLKMRLKQSVIERKTRINGPMSIRRHERYLQTAQRKQQKQHNNILATSNSNY